MRTPKLIFSILYWIWVTSKKICKTKNKINRSLCTLSCEYSAWNQNACLQRFFNATWPYNNIDIFSFLKDDITICLTWPYNLNPKNHKENFVQMLHKTDLILNWLCLNLNVPLPRTNSRVCNFFLPDHAVTVYSRNWIY